MAEIGDQRDLAGFDSLVGQDHAIDARPRMSVLDRLHVEVAEQGDLAPHRVREAAAPHYQRSLGRGRRAPSGPRRDPEGEIGDHGHERDKRQLDRTERFRRGQAAEQADRDRPGHAPGADRRRFVHRQVAHHAVVGVVEAPELRDQDPDREEGGQPDCPFRRQDECQRQAHRKTIGERQQSPAPHVTPPPELPRRPWSGLREGLLDDLRGGKLDGLRLRLGGDRSCALLVAHPGAVTTESKGTGLKLSARA
jgi:hypothetical protein